MFWDLCATGCWQSTDVGGGHRAQLVGARQHLLLCRVCNTSWLLFVLGPVMDLAGKPKERACIRVSINTGGSTGGKLMATEPSELTGAKPCY